MENNNINQQLPSKQKLIKSTILAIFIAFILLITIILPAEYGVDPIGFGKLVGLTKMGNIKVSISKDAYAEDKNPDKINGKLVKLDEVNLKLKPNEGREIKLNMLAGDIVYYQWNTDSGHLNYDIHGDSKKLKIKYFNYEKGSLEVSSGRIRAVFDGKHGFFWRNRTSRVVSIKLNVKGLYSKIEEIK